MSSKLRESWSSIQAARPTGESAIPYSVCGRSPISSAYATSFAKKSFSLSNWPLSSSDRPAGAGPPLCVALETSSGTARGKLV